MFLVLLPIKSLFQITQRCRTSRTFTTNIFNIVKKLLISATLVLKSYDKTHSKASESPYVHLAKGRCHDLANRLSHYLYFFSFLFFSFLIRLTTTRWSMGKYHMTLSQCHNIVMDGHRWSCHSHSHIVSHD